MTQYCTCRVCQDGEPVPANPLTVSLLAGICYEYPVTPLPMSFTITESLNMLDHTCEDSIMGIRGCMIPIESLLLNLFFSVACDEGKVVKEVGVVVVDFREIRAL